MPRRFVVLGSIVAAVFPTGAGVAQQAPAPVRVLEIGSALPVPFGERFDLDLTLRMAPGVFLVLPDSLPFAPAIEGAGPGVYEGLSQAPGDSLDLRISYPALAFLEGRIALPELPALVIPATGDGGSPPGPVAFSSESSTQLGAARLALRLGTLSVAPFPPIATADGPLAPRPPADVFGPSWGPWDVAVALGLLLGTVAAILRWMRAPGQPAPGEMRATWGLGRPAALVELDRILHLGWHREGRLADFYTETTGVLRRRLFDEEPRWGPWLTNRELTRRLVERWGGDDAETVRETVHVADRVRFSEHRTSASSAERDWATIRAWIATGPGGDAAEQP